jgi:NRPS condensation-like uncharacterized protein
MPRYRIEPLDEYMRIQEKSNDHQIRAVIVFKSHLNLDALRRSLKRSFDIIPVLGSKYVRTARNSYWDNSTVNYSGDDYFTLKNGTFSNKKLMSMLRRIPDQYSGPQLSAIVFRQTGNDILCIVVNHMVFDASGVKSYIYLLSQLYTQEEGGRGLRTPAINPERRLSVLLKNIGLMDKLKILFQKKNIDINKEKPLLKKENDEVAPRLFLRKIDNLKYKRIRSFCKKHEITVNDFMIALFSKALYDVNEYVGDEQLTLYTMIDLRQYDGNHSVSPFGNFSSMASIRLKHQEKDFFDLAKEINTKTGLMKSRRSGLKNVILLNMMHGFLSRNIFEYIFSKFVSSLNISTTNLGVIDKERLHWGGCAIDDAYMITSIKNQPAVQLTFSTYNDCMTLSTFGRYSSGNKKTIGKIFESFDDVLSNI